MKITYEYSHLRGYEILLHNKSHILKEIKKVIEAIHTKKNKISKEKIL